VLPNPSKLITNHSKPVLSAFESATPNPKLTTITTISSSHHSPPQTSSTHGVDLVPITHGLSQSSAKRKGQRRNQERNAEIEGRPEERRKKAQSQTSPCSISSSPLTMSRAISRTAKATPHRSPALLSAQPRRTSLPRAPPPLLAASEDSQKKKKKEKGAAAK
jgi:hypothetical protein